MVVSLPKSGTHLIKSILELMPGLQRQRRLSLNRKLRWHPYNFLPWIPSESCIIGVNGPRTIKLAALRHSLSRIGNSRFATGHIPYQPAVMEIFDDMDIAPLLMVRDPRDVVVSFMFYAQRKKNHFMHRAMHALPDNRQRLLAVIRGGRTRSGEPYLGIGAQLDAVTGYLDDERALILHFEELVGSRGGGDDEQQCRAIRAVGRRLGIELDDRSACDIGERMFGKGLTFRKGQIGGWHDHFDDEIAAAFAQEAGDRLARFGYAGEA